MKIIKQTRMLQRTTLILLFTFAVLTNGFSQENITASGEWILDQIAENGTYESIGQLVDFNQDGTLYVRELPFGTWNYNQAKNVITMDADDMSGDYEVVYLSETNMQLGLPSKDLYFSKIDRKKLEKDNLASGLIGLWEYANDMGDDTRRLIEFKAPDSVTLIEKSENMESRSSGMWLYDAELKRVTIIGQLERIQGINNEVTITDNEVNFVNNTVSTTLKRVAQDALGIERLNFSEKDFYDENGDYKYYDDEQKLPWKDSMEMMMKLVNVKQLVYSYSTLIEGANTFDKKTLTANVDSNPADQMLSIDYIFYGYDTYNLPDDTALPTTNFDEYSKLYPLKSDTFRVIGEAEITVVAGTFNCTVIEANGSFDERIKLWMINDQPGIIAKIIKDKPGRFGYYNEYELLKIKELK